MKRQFGKILAVLMAVMMVVSIFCITASAQTEDTNGAVVATQDEATMDETTADEATQDETTADESTADESTKDEATGDEVATGDEILGILGDVDLNGKVNIKDATLIQKALASIATLDELQYALADTNVDGAVNIKDATLIQKFLADIPTNELVGTEVTAEDLIPAVPENPTEPDVPATDDEIATDDEVATDDETATDDEIVATEDEVATDDEAATEDEVVVVPATKYYVVGWINNSDVYDNTYEIVDGTITIEITSDSYFAVMNEEGTIFWTEGWLDFNPTSAVLGEYGDNNNKFHVAAGTVTITWDAETFTLAKV